MTLPEIEQKLSQDPGSPLFARLAKELLSIGRVVEAKQLCVNGLRRYPAYATAHLVLAECYCAEKNYTKALEYVQSAQTILPDSALLRSLLDEWKVASTQQQREPSPPPKPVEIQPPGATDVSTEGNRLEEAPEAPRITQAEPGSLKMPLSWPLLSQELRSNEPLVPETAPASPMPHGELLVETAPPQRADEELSPSIDTRIVSKTLAEIYVSQGAFAEAILTYRLLKQKRPAQSEEIDQRIRELEPKAQEKATL